jgi:hypothetical protein
MRHARVLLSLVIALGQPWQAAAYQTYGIRVGDRLVPVKWGPSPVRYRVTDRGVTGVTSAQFRDAAGRAFATWQNVGTASVSAEFTGFTSAEPDEEDGQNTLGFLARPDLERVLGTTSFLFDEVTGEIVEADIFFNAAFPWSVAGAGETGKFDLESIIVHEVGHLFGLGHSGLGETELLAGGGRRVTAAGAVMFPIAFSPGNTIDRALTPDDVAGLSEVYPRSGFASTSGSISGRVTKNGRGVVGAHIVAFSPATGVLVGNFSADSNGAFTIASLAPGPYIIRVEPMDDAELESFFDDSVIPTVDLDFRVTYHTGLVVVPPGGGASPIEVRVVAK